MKPPTSVPIIILCLVYAYHPIMVHHHHHLKSPGRLGVLILRCVSLQSLQLLPQRSHGSLSRTDGLPLLLIKLFLRGKVAARNLVHGCLMMVQDPCITWPLWFVASHQSIYSSHGRLSECFDDSLLGSDEELGAVLTPLGVSCPWMLFAVLFIHTSVGYPAW